MSVHCRNRVELLILALTLSIFACAAEGPAGGTAGSASEALGAEIDALFAAYDEGAAPGAAVMVIRDDEVAHAEGYGLANIEMGTPIEPDTQIRLGSVSKQFVSMGIMILAEQGKIEYDDAATAHVPELAARYGHGITVRHLMSHTGGLPDYYDGELESVSADVWPRNEQGAEVFSRWGEPVFAPGDKYEYSNPGYEMLALIIQRVSGLSFREFMAAEIFEPLGMDSSLALDHTDPEIPRRAYGYLSTDDGGFDLYDAHWGNHMMGAGGIYSTLEDLYRWDQALYANSIVSAATLDEAFTKATLNSGEAIDYGFGWGLDEHDGHRRISHSGGWVGFRTHISRFPDDQLTVIVLSNRSDSRPGEMATKISDLFLRGDG